jgi:hypothetical protein
MDTNKIDFQIIKSKKSFIKRNEKGQAYADENGLIHESKTVFYLKRNGRLLKNPDDILGGTFLTLFLGAIVASIIGGISTHNTETPFLLIFIPTLILIMIGFGLVAKYSNEWLLYFMTKDDVDSYINKRERINENGIDGDVIERRQIIEKI